MNANPYQAPQDLSANFLEAAAGDSAEGTRRKYIKHESSVRSIGFLYYLGAIGFAVTLLSFVSLKIYNTTSRASDVAAMGAPVGEILILSIFLIILIIAGRGIRALKPWGRIVSIILSVIGLIVFPVGTIINGYILYLLLCKKGAFIFSPEYNTIIAATPDVKHKTSILVYIVFGILVLTTFALIFMRMK